MSTTPTKVSMDWVTTDREDAVEEEDAEPIRSRTEVEFAVLLLLLPSAVATCCGTAVVVTGVSAAVASADNCLLSSDAFAVARSVSANKNSTAGNLIAFDVVGFMTEYLKAVCLCSSCSSCYEKSSQRPSVLPQGLNEKSQNFFQKVAKFAKIFFTT